MIQSEVSSECLFNVSTFIELCSSLPQAAILSLYTEAGWDLSSPLSSFLSKLFSFDPNKCLTEPS